MSNRLENITLLVGDNLAKTITTTNPTSDWYSRLSFVSSVFDVNRLAHVPRNCFWPVPRTDADIVTLTFKEYPEDSKTLGLQLRQRIVISQPENLTLIKVINSFSPDIGGGKVLGKARSHRHDRRQAKTELRQMTLDLNRMSVSRKETRNNSIGTMEQTDFQIDWVYPLIY